MACACSWMITSFSEHPPNPTVFKDVKGFLLVLKMLSFDRNAVIMGEFVSREYASILRRRYEKIVYKKWLGIGLQEIIFHCEKIQNDKLWCLYHQLTTSMNRFQKYQIISTIEKRNFQYDIVYLGTKISRSFLIENHKWSELGKQKTWQTFVSMTDSTICLAACRSSSRPATLIYGSKNYYFLNSKNLNRLIPKQK